MAAWAETSILPFKCCTKHQSQTSTLDGLLSDTLTATELIKYMSILREMTAISQGKNNLIDLVSSSQDYVVSGSVLASIGEEFMKNALKTISIGLKQRLGKFTVIVNPLSAHLKGPS